MFLIDIIEWTSHFLAENSHFILTSGTSLPLFGKWNNIIYLLICYEIE